MAVVTGAGSGIGRALAQQLANRGCILALADINLENLEQTRTLLSDCAGECSCHVLDVADASAFQTFAENVRQMHGAVHVVINNAGVALVDTIENMSYEDFHWVMNVNFWGVVHGCKFFLPYLRESDEGHIVNISSVFGLMSLPKQSAYNASKFAVKGFTESLKMELAGSPIGVTCVHPGGIRTSIVENARVRTESLEITRDELLARFDDAAITTPERAATLIIRSIENNRRRLLIGRDARLIDFIVRIFAGSYEKILRLEKNILGRGSRSPRSD